MININKRKLVEYSVVFILLIAVVIQFVQIHNLKKTVLVHENALIQANTVITNIVNFINQNLTQVQ